MPRSTRQNLRHYVIPPCSSDSTPYMHLPFTVINCITDFENPEHVPTALCYKLHDWFERHSLAGGKKLFWILVLPLHKLSFLLRYCSNVLSTLAQSLKNCHSSHVYVLCRFLNDDSYTDKTIFVMRFKSNCQYTATAWWSTVIYLSSRISIKNDGSNETYLLLKFYLVFAILFHSLPRCRSYTATYAVKEGALTAVISVANTWRPVR